MEPERKHYLARIPTIALLILLGRAPWLAGALFILRAIDRDAEKKERARADYTANFRPQDTRQPYDYAPHAAPLGHDAPTAEQQKAKRRQQRFISLCGVAGVLLLLVGLTDIANVSHLLAVGNAGWFSALFSSLAQIAGGGGALAMSFAIRRTRKLERQLDKVVGSRDNIPLDELFAAAGIPAEKGRKVLETAIDHGYFGADAYIDNRTDFLVVRGDAPVPAEPAPEPAPGAETRQQGLLRRLREANAAITDPAINEKITRLEQLSARIFALAEEDEGKQAQLQKFNSYYLPTALKLLNTYAQLDRQGVDGENITATKQSIARSLDLLVTAFENQLDKLFQSDALDVSADIAALEGMLNLDGLSGESDFAPKL